MPRLPARTTLFPYTTLFRSVRRPDVGQLVRQEAAARPLRDPLVEGQIAATVAPRRDQRAADRPRCQVLDRKSTRLNSSHANISYAVFCLTKKIACVKCPSPT